jgi:hypothetical protein
LSKDVFFLSNPTFRIRSHFLRLKPKLDQLADSSRGLSVLTAIFGDLLFALMKPLQHCRSPWYQRGLICEAPPKVSVILLHDVEDRFLGEACA